MHSADTSKNIQEQRSEIIQRIDAGTSLVKETDDRYRELAKISNANQEQAEGIERINKAVTQMDKVVQEIAANSEESASASEELDSQAKALKEMADELMALLSKRKGSD